MKSSIYDQIQNQKRKVDFNTYNFSIKELISLIVIDHVIDIAPVYQRKFRWDDQRQSSLIESIFLGLPIPSLFMATNETGARFELIDGVQRISSIIRFAGTDEQIATLELRGRLKIVGLKKLTELNGLTFDELPTQIQLTFKMAIINVIVLTDKSDHEVRFDLFERLNRGGVILSDQEIRSCVYRGQFNDFIKRLAQNTDFKNSIKLTKLQQEDGTSEELILRFFAFLNTYKQFEHSVVDYLNTYMEEASRNFDYEKNEKIFLVVFDALSKALPKGITRKGRTPLNLFEAVSVGAALAYKNKGKINTSGVKEWINDKELNGLTTGATNSQKRVAGRIGFCQSRFEA
jgi:uncharacterized protein with ParB-like and HNH nuclease domain